VQRSVQDARAYPLADGLICLRVPLPYATPTSVNCYLIALQSGYCLVDCGTGVGLGWDALAHALDLAGVQPHEVDVLLCTHLHSDHAGLAAVVAERTGCELVRGAGLDSINDVLRDVAVPLSERRRAGRREGIPAHALDAMVDERLGDDGQQERDQDWRLLHDGDRLQTRLGDLTVLAIPGHSPTHIALLHEERRWMLSADLAFAAGSPFLEYGNSPDPYGEHLHAIERARELKLERLLPGHGRMISNPGEALGVAHRTVLAMADRVLASIDGRARNAYEVMLELLDGDPHRDRRQSNLSVTLCVLEHLERAGRAVSLDDAGVRKFMALA
jgi:glyoxylase-like metal-dependent hydrolase (beta-lactamase superfamily II)